jgi:hypothetical protein
MMAFLALVPRSVWLGLGAAALLVGAAWGLDHHGYQRGAAEVHVAWALEHEAMQKALDVEKTRQAQVVEKVVVEYRDRVKVEKEKADAITQYVPIMVDRDCTLSGGFRVLHDAAAAGALPEDPAGAARAAAPVEAPAVAATVAENYAACRADQARLTALQQLVKGIAP